MFSMKYSRTQEGDVNEVKRLLDAFKSRIKFNIPTITIGDLTFINAKGTYDGTAKIVTIALKFKKSNVLISEVDESLFNINLSQSVPNKAGITNETWLFITAAFIAEMKKQFPLVASALTPQTVILTEYKMRLFVQTATKEIEVPIGDRYLKRKTNRPAYKEIDPYDFDEELDIY